MADALGLQKTTNNTLSARTRRRCRGDVTVLLHNRLTINPTVSCWVNRGVRRPTMKCLLSMCFAIGILVTVCDAACFSTLPIHGGPEGCMYKRKYHEPGSTWRTKNCLDCSCSNYGEYHCCDVSGRPVNYDKEKCIALFNKATCIYTVVHKDDRSKTCAHAMVG
ncbi:beta-microseminoprotein [Bombina bombina]|uniref:beta-microseminoprotein n=1 Tax=Bombina bombina TaxID=8345 RepID=UPI00235B2440|nr:beta-microseminoprotein [Bombina bombina]